MPVTFVKEQCLDQDRALRCDAQGLVAAIRAGNTAMVQWLLAAGTSDDAGALSSAAPFRLRRSVQYQTSPAQATSRRIVGSRKPFLCIVAVWMATKIGGCRRGSNMPCVRM